MTYFPATYLRKHRLNFATLLLLGLTACNTVEQNRAEKDMRAIATPEANLQIQKAFDETYFFGLNSLPPLNTPANQSERFPYADISGENIYNYVSALTEFSKQSKAAGDVVWGRVQGSTQERLATEYVASKFKTWGLQDVRIESFPLTGGTWRPDAVSLELKTGAFANQPYQLSSATAAFPSGQTPAGGLTAPIEYVGFGTKADLRGKDLSGKIALLYVRVFDGVLLHSGLASAARIATETDAAGIILWMDAPGNAKYATQLFTPEGDFTQLPWVNIGYEDGAYLRRLYEESAPASPPQVTLTVRGQIQTEGTSQNLIGVLPGTTDENLIVTAHIDGFWNAILDNGSGVAALMELARYYSTVPQSERRRNLIFLVTGDHELSGSGGSIVFQNNHPELIANIALALQLEHITAPSVDNVLNLASLTNSASALSLFVSNGNQTIAQIFKDAIDKFDLVVRDKAIIGTGGDVDGLTEINSAGLIQTGYYYHSSLDELSLYAPQDFEPVTRAHAYIIDRLNEYDAAALDIPISETLPPPLYYAPELQEILKPW